MPESFPGYQRLLATGELSRRVAAATARLAPCDLCPRRCGVDRTAGELGICRAPAELMVASDNLHFGEEPPISGTRGSGTIFLSHCALRCRFCQNYPISHLGTGRRVSPADLATMMLRLQTKGAHNINFVTPSHYLPQIIAGVELAARDGLRMPLVWNCSGYEEVSALQLLDGIVDIYLPDAKYAEAEAAACCSGAPDYVPVNRAALKEMHRQVGELEIVDGLAVRGLLLRHLVLPDELAGSRAVLTFIRDELSPRTYLAVLSQYFPAFQAVDDPRLGRGVSRAEYEAVLAVVEELGLEVGLIQDVPLR